MFYFFDLRNESTNSAVNVFF
ncbi:hypothetical protein DSUL_80036 [Desulfovibrionales bacterium]